MQTPADTRIAEDNRLQRAVQQALAPAPIPPAHDAALLDERLAVHSKDSGADTRSAIAKEVRDLSCNVHRYRKNPTLSGPQKLLSIDDLVRPRAADLLAKCEEEGAVIDTLQRNVDAGLDAALTPPAAIAAVLPEYRAALLAMTDDQRDMFIERLQGTRHDAALRYAIASVPHELSGVSFGVHKRMVDTSLALKDPALLTRPADLKRRRAALAVAIDGIRRTVAELVDGEAADALRALASGRDVP